jgi:hypothetical protein
LIEQLEKEKAGTTKEPEPGEEWMEYWDDAAQAYYYFNSITHEASWTRPDDFTVKEEDILFDGDENATDYDTAGTALTTHYAATFYIFEYGDSNSNHVIMNLIKHQTQT